METNRTAQIVAWTIVGTVVGALMSALAILSLAILPHQTPIETALGYMLFIAILGIYGVPPGCVGGFLMGLFVAPIRELGARHLAATILGTAVGFLYAGLLSRYVQGIDLYVIGLLAGGAGGFCTSTTIEMLRKGFNR